MRNKHRAHRIMASMKSHSVYFKSPLNVIHSQPVFEVVELLLYFSRLSSTQIRFLCRCWFCVVKSGVRGVVLDSSTITAGGRSVSPDRAGNGGQGTVPSGQGKLGRCSVATHPRKGMTEFLISCPIFRSWKRCALGFAVEHDTFSNARTSLCRSSPPVHLDKVRFVSRFKCCSTPSPYFWSHSCHVCVLPFVRVSVRSRSSCSERWWRGRVRPIIWRWVVDGLESTNIGRDVVRFPMLECSTTRRLCEPTETLGGHPSTR